VTIEAAKPLQRVLVEALEASGRWAYVPSPVLCWCDLVEAQQSGMPARAYSTGDAIVRELRYQEIV
jgi:hypothetical protein